MLKFGTGNIHKVKVQPIIVCVYVRHTTAFERREYHHSPLCLHSSFFVVATKQLCNYSDHAVDQNIL